MSQEIRVTLPAKRAHQYPIVIGANLSDISAWLPRHKFNRLVIITDHKIKKLYGDKLQKSLKRTGYPCVLLSFPAGEKSKTYKTKQALENSMLKHHCGRDTLILALGGGVVGDLAGFIAATYLRGLPLIQIPTTLLAMIDSSVGGKTAINTPQGKNLIGAIHQPLSVLADLKVLKSLSKKDKINGLVEALKMFLTHDAASFDYFEKHLPRLLEGNDKHLREVVKRALKIKAFVVGRDEAEQGERSLLNFGHTFGHALEKASNYKLMHGYAVAYGILVETVLSRRLGLLSAADLARITKLLKRIGFEGQDLKKYSAPKLIQASKSDKKNRQGKQHCVLLKKIGRAHIAHRRYTHALSDQDLRLALKNTIGEVKNGR